MEIRETQIEDILISSPALAYYQNTGKMKGYWKRQRDEVKKE